MLFWIENTFIKKSEFKVGIVLKNWVFAGVVTFELPDVCQFDDSAFLCVVSKDGRRNVV